MAHPSQLSRSFGCGGVTLVSIVSEGEGVDVRDMTAVGNSHDRRRRRQDARGWIAIDLGGDVNS